jgi:hypothetical protein
MLRENFYAEAESPKHNGRISRFWMNAYKPGMHLWNIHMHADWVPSVSLTTSEEPLLVYQRLVKEWEEHL